MKHAFTITLVTIVTLFALSCSKSGSSSPTPTPGVSSSISGLTSISQAYNIGVISDIGWAFSGSNPITISPSLYSGNKQLNFTGTNVTQFVYNNSTVPGFGSAAFTINITYNLSNQIDTLTLLNTGDSLIGNVKYAFQYSGSQISKVILAHQYTSGGMYTWTLPDTYYFTYSGSNIVQINASINYQTSGHDSEVYKYFIDTRANNFAGSLPTYFLLNNIESVSGGIDPILTYFALYLNPNLTDSIQIGYKVGNIGTDTYKTFVDSAGRVSMRIWAYTTPYPDTTIFHY